MEFNLQGQTPQKPIVAEEFKGLTPPMPAPALASAVLDVEGENVDPLALWQHALPGSAPAEAFDVVVPHGDTPLSSFDPEFWTLCFPHLFPYGDGLRGTA